MVESIYYGIKRALGENNYKEEILIKCRSFGGPESRNFLFGWQITKE